MVKLIIIALAITSMSSVQASIFADPLSLSANLVGLGQFAFELMKQINEKKDYTLSHLSQDLEKMNNEINRNFEVVLNKIRDQPGIEDLVNERKKIGEHSFEIASIFKYLVETKKSVDESENPIGDELILTLKQEKLDESMSGIRSIMSHDQFYSFLTSDFHTKLKKYENVCTTKMSHLQLLRSLYGSLKLTTAQYYTSIRMIYYIIQKEGKVDKSRQIANLNRNVLDNYREDVNQLKEQMKIASREFWRCDPEGLKEINHYEENEDGPFSHLHIFSNYIAITSTFDKGFLNCESDCKKITNPLQRQVCINNCPKTTHINKCGKYDHLCKKIRLCPNELQECKFLPQTYENFIAKESSICLNGNTKAMSRYSAVYEFAREEYFRCDDEKNIMRISNIEDTWNYELSQIYYTCKCTESIHYVAKVNQFARQDYVIVGARFRVHEKTLYIQAQEGKLLPNGMIDKNTLSWMKINYVNDDLFRTKISDIKSFDLTGIKLPSDRVITGIGLSNRAYDPAHNRYHVTIMSTQFDFKTGRLMWRPSTSISHSPLPGTKKYNLTDCDVPNRSDRENIPNSKDDEFVEMTITSLEKDGGQTTIPFIDTQDVASYSPAPLSGVSLYMRGQKGYGGYLAIKFETYDFTPYIVVDSDLNVDFDKVW